MDSMLESVNRFYPNVAPQVTKIINSKMGDFKTVQCAFFTIGTHINVDDISTQEEMPTRNYDELLTNIRLISTRDTLLSIEKIVSDNYPAIVCDAQSIRNNVKIQIKEIFDAYLNNVVFSLRKTNQSKTHFDKLKGGTGTDVLKMISGYVNDEYSGYVDKMVDDIERGIFLYTLLIAGILMKNVSGWYSEEFRMIYHTKVNTILCSLSNYEYSSDIFESMFKYERMLKEKCYAKYIENLPKESINTFLLCMKNMKFNKDISLYIAKMLYSQKDAWNSCEFPKEHYLNQLRDELKYPKMPNKNFEEIGDNSSLYSALEIAFLKRSQLLPRLFEKVYEDKMKYYQEIGLSDIHIDYKEGGQSTVACHKCKGFYTDYFQLQTRSADEPMTIFYYCRQCGNRGRR